MKLYGWSLINGEAINAMMISIIMTYDIDTHLL